MEIFDERSRWEFFQELWEMNKNFFGYSIQFFMLWYNIREKRYNYREQKDIFGNFRGKKDLLFATLHRD